MTSEDPSTGLVRSPGRGAGRVFQLTDEMKEGKYLVVRRDGTVPVWPHFVLSARDPASPEALRTYAYRASALKLPRAYTDDVWHLSRVFEDYAKQYGNGDPAAPAHRQDNSFVLAMMRHETDLTGLGQLPRARDDVEYIGALTKIVTECVASLTTDDLSPAAKAVRSILQTAQDVLRAKDAHLTTGVSGGTAVGELPAD